MDALADEWPAIARLLPRGWAAAANSQGALRRARGVANPAALLRALLFHASWTGSLRSCAAQLRKAGVASLSDEALRQRLRSSRRWLQWIAQRLTDRRRSTTPDLKGLRPRAVDSTTLQPPAYPGSRWRLHYTLDLLTLDCDWFDLTDASEAERLEKVPVRRGDVLFGDRNFLRVEGVRHVVDAQGHVLMRLRWRHAALLDGQGRRVRALSRARRLRIDEIGDWNVQLGTTKGSVIAGRLVVLKLPLPLADKAQRKATRTARRKGKTLDPRTLEAARYVMLFTTLPVEVLDGEGVLEWYRFRWQIEIGFKRFKQLLKLGQLPHTDPELARSWILAKVVVALLLETLYHQAESVSPWGYERARGSESVASNERDGEERGAGTVPGGECDDAVDPRGTGRATPRARGPAQRNGRDVEPLDA
jgi:IS4 transposase